MESEGEHGLTQKCRGEVLIPAMEMTSAFPCSSERSLLPAASQDPTASSAKCTHE